MKEKEESKLTDPTDESLIKILLLLTKSCWTTWKKELHTVIQSTQTYRGGLKVKSNAGEALKNAIPHSKNDKLLIKLSKAIDQIDAQRTAHPLDPAKAT